MAKLAASMELRNWAGSTGQRNELAKFLYRHHMTVRLAWSCVETSLNSRQVI
jgi:hypothetical protein